MDNPNPELNNIDTVEMDSKQAVYENQDFEIKPILPEQIYFLIRKIKDPEHTDITLEELGIVDQELIKVSNNIIKVQFIPTVPHCSVASVIGLAIKIKIMENVPKKYKIDVHIKNGTHIKDYDISKQLCDKERVFAAYQNEAVLNVIRKCL